MYYASVDFPRRAAFAKAVRDGSAAVLLFNPDLGIPAVNGEVTVVGPWNVRKYETRDPHFLERDRPRGMKHGWSARVVVRDMRVTEIKES